MAEITQTFDGKQDNAGIVNAPAGLPFFGGVGAAPVQSGADLQPPKADIVVGGRGGGPESAPPDPIVQPGF